MIQPSTKSVDGHPALHSVTHMAGYTKLFNSILASTIWREDDKTRIVWITLLAMSDKNGVAEGSVPGLADFARVSVDDCRAALCKLSAPDPDSRSTDFQGSRIKAVDGGWQILNHAKYRAKMGADERREYLRKKQAEHRQRVNTLSTGVNNCSESSTPSTHSDLDAASKASSSKLQREKPCEKPPEVDRYDYTEAGVLARFRALLGDAEMGNGGKWRNRIRQSKESCGKVLRVLEACESDAREKKAVASWAAFSEDTWKRFGL